MSVPILDATDLNVLSSIVYRDLAPLLRDDISDAEWNFVATLFINFHLQREDGTIMAKVPPGWTLLRNSKKRV